MKEREEATLLVTLPKGSQDIVCSRVGQLRRSTKLVSPYLWEFLIAFKKSEATPPFARRKEVLGFVNGACSSVRHGQQELESSLYYSSTTLLPLDFASMTTRPCQESLNSLSPPLSLATARLLEDEVDVSARSR